MSCRFMFISVFILYFNCIKSYLVRVWNAIEWLQRGADVVVLMGALHIYLSYPCCKYTRPMLVSCSRELS